MKSFELSLSLDTITIFWQVILLSTIPKNLLTKNSICQAVEKFSRLISRAETFIYCLKQLEISLIMTPIIASTNALIEKPLDKFFTNLSISTNKKSKNYNIILVIVNWLIKILYSILIKVIINTPRLTEIFFNIVVQYYCLLNLNISNKSLLFISKFLLLIYYFIGVKQHIIKST